MTRPQGSHDRIPASALGRVDAASRAAPSRSVGDRGHVADSDAVGDRDSVGDLDLADRQALRRVRGLSTELSDVTDVEYRQLRLERVVLVGLWSDPGDAGARESETSLAELAALAETAGSAVLDAVLQRRPRPDPATYLGAGKAAELRDIVEADGADTVVTDDELTPSQRRGLEDVVNVKVVDRTALILDIFAQHARSREGKAQVELAQLQYLLPRLRGWGESMSRQAGGRVAAGAGIGSRGPGETKIELDRRRINQRIARLRRDIRSLGTTRETQRRSRRRRAVPSVAIAGYTNAGKSSLMNRLTGAGVLVEDALFATLDPTVRRARTDDGREFTLTDTVGFVRRLPHQLVEAFRSTLEEVAQSDLLLHVVDGSHPDPLGQVAAVREVLADIGAVDLPELVVLNKSDAAEPETVRSLLRQEPAAVIVSARTGAGVGKLRTALANALPRPPVEVDLVVPFARGDLVSRVYAEGEIVSVRDGDGGTHVHAYVNRDLAGALASGTDRRSGVPAARSSR